VACGSCGEVLGLECVGTPQNHVLQRDQLLLRISAVAVVDGHTGLPVEINAARSLALRNYPRASADPEIGAGQHHRQTFPPSRNPGPQQESAETTEQDGAEIFLLRADVDRLDTAGHQIVSAIDNVVARIDKEVSSLKDTMRLIQRDLGGSQDDIASLKAELNEMKKMAQKNAATLPDLHRDFEGKAAEIKGEVSALKADLVQVKRDMAAMKGCCNGHSAILEGQSKELAAVGSDLIQVRRRLDQDRSKIPPEASSTSFPSTELNILTSNIVKIGNRASKVETLQMEFDILKERVERIERARPDTQATANPPLPRRWEEREERQPRRKRRSSPEISSSKRPMLSSDVPDDSLNLSEGAGSSPPVASEPRPATRSRLSKAGNVIGESARRGYRHVGR